MSKPVFQSSEIISFAVMLLMLVALVAGQADATVRAASQAARLEPTAILDSRLMLDVDSQLGTTALKIAVDVAADLSYFRSEDEGNR